MRPLVCASQAEKPFLTFGLALRGPSRRGGGEGEEDPDPHKGVLSKPVPDAKIGRPRAPGPASGEAQAQPACLGLLVLAGQRACSLTPGRPQPRAKGSEAGASSQLRRKSPQRATRSSHGAGMWASALGAGRRGRLSDVGPEPVPLGRGRRAAVGTWAR